MDKLKKFFKELWHEAKRLVARKTPVGVKKKLQQLQQKSSWLKESFSYDNVIKFTVSILLKPMCYALYNQLQIILLCFLQLPVLLEKVFKRTLHVPIKIQYLISKAISKFELIRILLGILTYMWSFDVMNSLQNLISDFEKGKCLKKLAIYKKNIKSFLTKDSGIVFFKDRFHKWCASIEYYIDNMSIVDKFFVIVYIIFSIRVIIFLINLRYCLL